MQEIGDGIEERVTANAFSADRGRFFAILSKSAGWSLVLAIGSGVHNPIMRV